MDSDPTALASLIVFLGLFSEKSRTENCASRDRKKIENTIFFHPAKAQLCLSWKKKQKTHFFFVFERHVAKAKPCISRKNVFFSIYERHGRASHERKTLLLGESKTVSLAKKNRKCIFSFPSGTRVPSKTVPLRKSKPRLSQKNKKHIFFRFREA